MAPAVEHRLIARREHLETEADRTAGVEQRLDQTELGAVDVHRSVLFAEQDDVDRVEAACDLVWRQEPSGARVAHGIERHLDGMTAAGRVADRQVELAPGGSRRPGAGERDDTEGDGAERGRQRPGQRDGRHGRCSWRLAAPRGGGDRCGAAGRVR